jgi:4-amino-4-deoxy-L-arabinose transferase-like glycosyltransferase
MMVGLLLGLSGLLKGPAGPVIFYMTIGSYLVWTRRWRELFSSGHLACLALAILPAAIWVGALVDRGVISTSELIGVWGEQLGLIRKENAIAIPDDQWSRRLTHYAEFPFQVVGMFFPAVVWMPFAFRRRWSNDRRIPDDIRKFLLCGAIVPFLVFYLYPESRARHLMPAAFSAAVLAAIVVTAMKRAPGRWANRGRLIALALATLPALFTIAGVALATLVHVECLPCAVAGLAVGLVWSSLAVVVTRRTPHAAGVISFAVTLSTLPLAVWFVINLVVIPWRAPYATSTDAIVVAERLPPGEVIYTTRTFPGKGERFYNLQFHLAPELRAANDLNSLKNAAPCIAVVAPQERMALQAEGWNVEEIGRMGGRDGQPMVYVIRLAPAQMARRE